MAKLRPRKATQEVFKVSMHLSFNIQNATPVIPDFIQSRPYQEKLSKYYLTVYF